MKRLTGLVVALLTGAVCAGGGALAAEPVPVTLGRFDGPKARDGRKLERAVRSALKKKNKHVAIAREGEAAYVLLEGELTKEGRQYAATVRVLDAGSGAVVHVVMVESRSTNRVLRKLKRVLYKQAGGAIAEAHARALAAVEAARSAPPPEPEAPATVEPTTVIAPVEPPVEDEPTGRSPLTAALGARVFTRSYAYNDDLHGGLRGYELSVAPQIALELAWFPGAHFTDGIGASFGLHLAGHLAVGVDSQDGDGTAYDTSALGALVGLLFRLPIGAHEIDLAVGYGYDSFEVDASAPVPSTGYGFLRAGAAARFVVGPLWFGLGGAYLVVLDGGGVTSDEWFPRADAGGFDVAAHVGVDIAYGLGVEAGFEMRHFFFTFNPEPGDRWIAGGATDQYLMGSLRLVYRLGS